MTAWRHRHKLPPQKAISQPAIPQPLSALDKLSIHGMANAAAGALLADGAKAMFSNEPSVADLLKRIEGLEHKLGYSMGSMSSQLKALQDHNQAVEQSNPMLAFKVASIRKQRLKKGS